MSVAEILIVALLVVTILAFLLSIFVIVSRLRDLSFNVRQSIRDSLVDINNSFQRSAFDLTNAIQRIPLYSRYESRSEDDRWRDDVSDILRRLERERPLRLSWGAREMLTVPVLEAAQESREFDWREAERSIEIIMEDMLDLRSTYVSSHLSSDNARDSRAVIRAFHNRFCNIPPFCSRVDVRR